MNSIDIDKYIDILKKNPDNKDAQRMIIKYYYRPLFNYIYNIFLIKMIACM